MRLSEVRVENDRFKIHAEFFKIDNLKSQNDIKKHHFSKLKNILHYNSRYSQPIYNHICDSIILNSQHIRNDEIKYTLARKGSNKKILKTHDILLTSTGVGTLGRVNMHYANCNTVVSIDNHITVIRSKSTNHCYLMIYLQSRYGQFQIDKHYSGTSGQIEIYPQDISEFIIPILSNNFQSKIESLVTTSHEKLQQSKSLYAEAERLLLQELDLVDFKPSTENIAIKTLSESFSITERLDAEYYQPKYEEIENALLKYKLGYDSIGSLFKLSKRTFKVDKDKLYEYVEIGSIDVSSGEIMPEFITGAELPANAKRRLSTGQIIVSKVRTYRSGIAMVNKDNYIGSGAFCVLEEKSGSQVSKETLFLFLRSNLFLEWSLKPNTGTSYPVILDEDILNFNIPLIDKNVQNIIAAKIQQSFALRKESKRLLDLAKQSVEMAIEQNEEIAMNWLNKANTPKENIDEKL